MAVAEDAFSDPQLISQFTERDVDTLLGKAIAVLGEEPNLVHLPEGTLLFVGDTHGNLDATRLVVSTFLDTDCDHIIFLGDYVDRGLYQIENLVYVYALKLLYPERVTLLRGNHETASVNADYGFFDAVVHRYSRGLYDRFAQSFAQLPLAALTDNNIIAVHGGLPKGLESIAQIDELVRMEEEPNDELALQLLWNDPDENLSGFAINYFRGGFYLFGKDVFLQFLDTNKLNMMIRAHQCFPEGYKYLFDAKLLSLFSCPYYHRASAGRFAVLHEHEDKPTLELVRGVDRFERC